MDQKTDEQVGVTKALESFEAISLEETQKAALMDRVEVKFLLSTRKLLKILPTLKEHYQVLKIEGEALMAYTSVYQDSADFAFYRAHHDGRLRRQKVRFRHYQQTDANFFEIKLRSSSGRTRKKRIAVDEADSTSEERCGTFLHEQLPHCVDLEPKLEVSYQRVTLVSRTDEERLTLDFGLSLGKPGETPQVIFERAVVAELKRSVHARASCFETVARTNRLHRGGFSKYGVGCGLTYRGLKYNNFKPQLLAIHKVEHDGR